MRIHWGTEPNVDGIEFRIISDSNQDDQRSPDR